jgi:hypothetical protein
MGTVKNVAILGLRIKSKQNAQCAGKRLQGTGRLAYRELFLRKEK